MAKLSFLSRPYRLVIIIPAFCLVANLFSTCTYKNEQDVYPVNDCDTTNVSYKNFVRPTIWNSCRSCHYDSTMVSSGTYLSFQTYNDLLAVVKNHRLEPAFKPAQHSTNKPIILEKPLSHCDALKMLAWIHAGGPNN